MKQFIKLFLFFSISPMLLFTCKKDGNKLGNNEYGTLTITVKNENKVLLDNATLVMSPSTESPQAKGNGQYVFKNLKPEKYEIKASLTGYCDTIINIIIEKSEQYTEVVLKKAFGKIEGVVMSEGGSPLSSGYVMLIPSFKTTTINHDGTYNFEDLEVGKLYRAHVFCIGYKSNSKSNIEAKIQPNKADGSIALTEYESSLRLDKAFIDFGDLNESSGYATFGITTTSDWQIIGSPSWINLEDEYKQGIGNGVVFFSLNKQILSSVSFDDRLAEIVVKAGSAEQSIWVAVSGTGTGIDIGRIITQRERYLTANSVVIPCVILNDSLRKNAKEIGVYFSENKNLDYSVAKDIALTEMGENGRYEVSFGIEAGKTYYACAYVIDKNNSSYPITNNTIVFTTNYSLPKIEMQNVNTTYNSAKFNLKINAEGLPKYKELGFVYAENDNPTLENTIKLLPANSNFSAETPHDLDFNKNYWVRAYAKSHINNKDTTVYSEPAFPFKLNVNEPSFTKPIVSNLNLENGTAMFETNITLGDLPIIERGFAYGITSNPARNSQNIPIVSPSTAEGKYNEMVKDIPHGKYFVQAYVVTAQTTHYSPDAQFDFQSKKPVVYTYKAEKVENHKATLVGYIDNIGEPAYSERGFLWSDSRNTPVAQWKPAKKDEIKAIGEYRVDLTELTPATEYFYRAYVMVDDEPIYDNEVSFKTTYDFIRVPYTTIEMQAHDISTGSNWEMAKEQCESSPLDGGGWRLPNIDEWSAMHSAYKADILDENFCVDLGGCEYWSSTLFSGYEHKTYLFSMGLSFWAENTSHKHVRCVRDAQ